MGKILPSKTALISGQTLISLIIATAVFAILASAIFSLTSSSFQLVGFNRARITARHIAQEKIELIRNMPFDDVGTTGGIPSGPIQQSENIFKNGLNYIVTISIVYVDDPFDNIAPDDLLPTDYKRVRIDVSWEGLTSTKSPIVLATDIAPKGIETSEGGGTLSILVFDAFAVPVAQADVNIFSDDVVPIIDLDLQTNDNGRVVLPGAPACIECYDITVTKSGYSTDKTYTTAEVANPNQPPISIVESDLTEVSFAIDKTSTLNMSSVTDRDSGFTPIPNVTFLIQGSKTIGTDTLDFPVYKFDKQYTTGGGGELVITDVEWDNYSITLPGASSYDIAGTNPLVPFPLNPDLTIEWALALTSASINSLLVAFTDASLSPIASVSATLADSPSYEETIFSGAIDNPDFGQVFFRNLSATIHTLDATASGYLDYNDTVDILDYTIENIILTDE